MNIETIKIFVHLNSVYFIVNIKVETFPFRFIMTDTLTQTRLTSIILEYALMNYLVIRK